jgi:DNA-directed RNA polymerase subunit F
MTAPRVWTHLYFEFSLSAEDRARLDAHTAATGRPLVHHLRTALEDAMRVAGIDPQTATELQGQVVEEADADVTHAPEHTS